MAVALTRRSHRSTTIGTSRFMGLKSVVERAVVATGAARLARRRARGTLILAYHNIIPDDHPPFGDLSLHLSRSAFLAQLDELRATCNVVPLDQVALPGPPTRRPRVAITFDDCYAGSIAIGVPELVERALPATFFAPPGLLGGQTFWWDAIAATSEGGLTNADREQALTGCRGEGERVRRWAVETGHPWRTGSTSTTSGTEEELRAAARQPGITIGSHTWSHPNVVRLSPDELTRELQQTRAWVASLGEAGRPDWISWPYGLVNDAATSVAAGLGLSHGLRIDGGWHHDRSPSLQLPRLNIPAGLSLNGFRLRLAGLLSR